MDVETKLIVSLVVGRRTRETVEATFQDYYQRTDGELPELIITDEYPAYFTVIVATYGVRKEDLELTEAERAEVGWDELPAVHVPEEIAYATVHKEREGGRVVAVEPRLVLGEPDQVAAVLEGCDAAPTVNMSYVERWYGTQRHFNARKARKVYTFSKDLAFHIAVTWLVVVAYNWCWKPRTLREQIEADPPRYKYWTPAMAASLTEEVWTLTQILSYPIYRQPDRPKKRKRRKRNAKRPEGG